MFVEGKSRTIFFPSDTLIDGISLDGTKNFNIRTCEHMILGQLRMGVTSSEKCTPDGDLFHKYINIYFDPFALLASVFPFLAGPL